MKLFVKKLNDIKGETNDKTPVYVGTVAVTYQFIPERSAWIQANASHYGSFLIIDNLVRSAVKSAMIELGSINMYELENLAKRKNVKNFIV